VIGVFDSGIGGLTVLRQLIHALPGESMVYLGDTARVPYGTRSPRTVVRYAMRVASYLRDHGVDLLVVACNTATSHAIAPLRAAGEKVGMQVVGVIRPGVEAALGAHRGGTIAVLGTEGTVQGGVYQALLAERRPGCTVRAVACPLFVPLVEEGWLEGEVPQLVAHRYLSPLRGVADTAILGCTHYPLLKPVIQAALPRVTLVDSAVTTAAAVARLRPPTGGGGEVRFLVTDHIDRFCDVGERFLGARPRDVTWVDLGPPRAPFVEI
jgi:glutamate racemase